MLTSWWQESASTECTAINRGRHAANNHLDYILRFLASIPQFHATLSTTRWKRDFHENFILKHWTHVIHTGFLVLFYSSRPSNAYMHQLTRPSLVQVRVCRLFDDNPSSYPIMFHCQIDLRNMSQCKFKSKVFHQEKAFKNVVRKMTAILSRPQCVKTNHINALVFIIWHAIQVVIWVLHMLHFIFVAQWPKKLITLKTVWIFTLN